MALQIVLIVLAVLAAARLGEAVPGRVWRAKTA